MNFAGNFADIGQPDIAALRERVLAMPDEAWRKEPLRQQHYEIHRDTETISLVFDPDFRHTHPTRLPALATVLPVLRPVLEMAADYYDNSTTGRQLREHHSLGYFIRANLVKLKAGGRITAHKDNNFSLAHSHRIHLPLVTYDQVLFIVGDETRHLGEGQMAEINNRRMHAVQNDSEYDRIHLILDYVMPGEKCCCGARRHPDTACSPQACHDTDLLQVPCNCFPEAGSVAS